jgi:N utilization substance protein A
MKNEFLTAVTQLSAEKNLSPDVVLEAVEAALASAYKKDNLASANLAVHIDRNTGAVRVFMQKAVVEEVEDEKTEITPADALTYRPDAQLGETIEIETTPQYAGRIAAQTAKQVVLQRLREAEREVVFDEYSGKEGEILSGTVQRLEGRNAIIDLGKTEAVMPPQEQVRIEHYRVGQRLKFYLVEVFKATRGPQVMVSRTHKNLIRRLFELEVPEIFRGTVELKAIAREPGYRSKVAVWSRQEGVDPVGACVGPRGIRIQNIVNELNGERIDVVMWNPNPSLFVANALSPAQVFSVNILPDDNTAEVVVPDRQLSLAIGKEGQNARLAAKLTGLRIDIKSQTTAEAEAATRPPAAPEEPEPVAAEAAPSAAGAKPTARKKKRAAPPDEEEPSLTPEQETVLAAEGVAAGEAAKGETIAEAPPAEEAAPKAPAPVKPAKPVIRFAEEVLPARTEASAGGKRKRTKSGKGRVQEQEAAVAARPKRSKKVRPHPEEELDEMEELEELV